MNGKNCSLSIQFFFKNELQLLDEHRGRKCLNYLSCVDTRQSYRQDRNRKRLIVKQVFVVIPLKTRSVKQVFVVIPLKKTSSKLIKSNQPNYLHLPLIKTGLMNLLYFDKNEINDTFFIVQWGNLQDANSIGIDECLVMA